MPGEGEKTVNKLAASGLAFLRRFYLLWNSEPSPQATRCSSELACVCGVSGVPGIRHRAGGLVSTEDLVNAQSMGEKEKGAPACTHHDSHRSPPERDGRNAGPYSGASRKASCRRRERLLRSSPRARHQPALGIFIFQNLSCSGGSF